MRFEQFYSDAVELAWSPAGTVSPLPVTYEIQCRLTGAYAIHPTPYTLHPTPYALHPTPYTPHPTPYTLNPSTLHSNPHTSNPKP